MTDLSSRVDDLEIRFAQAERTIADLNDVITAQWRKIEALDRHLARMAEEMQTLDRRADGVEPPPPHY